MIFKLSADDGHYVEFEALTKEHSKEIVPSAMRTLWDITHPTEFDAELAKIQSLLDGATGHA